MTKIHQSLELKTLSGETRYLGGTDSNCPVCGSDKKEQAKYLFSPFSIVQCAQCTTLHLTPLPTPELLSQIYNSNYYHDEDLEHGYLDYSAQSTNIKKTYKRRLRYLKNFLPLNSSPKILEIGCALGFGLSEAVDILGGSIIGCDVSQEAVESTKKLGFVAYLSNFYGISQEILPQSIDVIYAFDVIEHLPNVNLFIDWVKKVLRPGGILFLTTPDMDHILNRLLGRRSPSIKIPQHISYFTKSSLKKALSDGFTLEADAWDFQHVKLDMLISRISHILGMPIVKNEFGPTVLIPNGMRMFFFRKDKN